MPDCIKKLTLLLVALTSVAVINEARAQKKQPPLPAWVTMMDDPNVNYFEAVKAFEAYWKGKEKPIEEEERFGSVEDKQKEEKLKTKERKLSDSDPAKLYAFEYKKFLWWMKQTEPFVQPDGRIKTMDERVSEWKAQKQQKKEQQLKLKKNPSKKN